MLCDYGYSEYISNIITYKYYNNSNIYVNIDTNFVLSLIKFYTKCDATDILYIKYEIN